MTIQITKLSHSSWFKVKSNDMVIHLDPGYAGYFENQGVPDKELKDKANLVLVSHFHKDHLQPEAVDMISGKHTQILAPKNCVERIPHPVTIVKPGDEMKIDGITIRAVDAYNTPAGCSTRKVHHQGDGVGYLITIHGKRLYHAGDTDLIPEMNRLEAVDVAMLPIGGKYTMDIDEAVKALIAINPAIVIPMHQSNEDPLLFKEKVEKQSEVRVVNLSIGETFRLDQ